MKVKSFKKLLQYEVNKIGKKENLKEDEILAIFTIAVGMLKKPQEADTMSNAPDGKITSDPSQWKDLLKAGESSIPMWQNTFDRRYFSKDAGQTWYNVEQEHAKQALKNAALDLKRYDPIVTEESKQQSYDEQVKRLITKAWKDKDPEAYVYYSDALGKSAIAAFKRFKNSWAYNEWKQDQAPQIKKVEQEFERRRSMSPAYESKELDKNWYKLSGGPIMEKKES